MLLFVIKFINLLPIFTKIDIKMNNVSVHKPITIKNTVLDTEGKEYYKINIH